MSETLKTRGAPAKPVLDGVGDMKTVFRARTDPKHCTTSGSCKKETSRSTAFSIAKSLNGAV